jgi:hypothetical protein
MIEEIRFQLLSVLTRNPRLDTSDIMKSFAKAVPWFRRLVAGLSPRSPGSVHVEFVVDEVTVLRFSPVNFISPVLH